MNLKNTYIKNDHGKLRDLFIAELKKIGAETCADDRESFSYLMCKEVIIYSTYHNCNGQMEHNKLNANNDHYKQLTLADFEPQNVIMDAVNELQAELTADNCHHTSNEDETLIYNGSKYIAMKRENIGHVCTIEQFNKCVDDLAKYGNQCAPSPVRAYDYEQHKIDNPPKEVKMISLRNVKLDCRDSDGVVNQEMNKAFQDLVKERGIDCQWTHNDMYHDKPFLLVDDHKNLFYRDEKDIEIRDVSHFTNVYMTLVNDQYVLSDTKPQPKRFKVDYELIEDFTFDLKSEFEDGKLYRGGNDYTVITIEDDVAYHSQEENLYRKVKAEITREEELFNQCEQSLKDKSGKSFVTIGEAATINELIKAGNIK